MNSGTGLSMCDAWVFEWRMKLWRIDAYAKSIIEQTKTCIEGIRFRLLFYGIFSPQTEKWKPNEKSMNVENCQVTSKRQSRPWARRSVQFESWTHNQILFNRLSRNGAIEWVVVVTSITPNPIISDRRNIFRFFFFLFVWHTNRYIFTYTSNNNNSVWISNSKRTVLRCVPGPSFVLTRNAEKLLLNYIIWWMRIPFMSIVDNTERHGTDCAPHRLKSYNI